MRRKTSARSSGEARVLTAVRETPPPLSQAAVPAVALNDVSVRFTTEHGTVAALRSVSFSIAQGGFLTIVGPSGCGKSTLLRVMAGLITPISGAVGVLGEAPGVARRRRDIGFVFQDPALLPWRSVMDNVRLPLEVGGQPKAEARDPGE